MPLQTQLGGHSEYYDEYTMPFLDGSSHNNLHSSYPTPVVHTGTSCSLFQVRLGSHKSPISLFTETPTISLASFWETFLLLFQ